MWASELTGSLLAKMSIGINTVKKVVTVRTVSNCVYRIRSYHYAY